MTIGLFDPSEPVLGMLHGTVRQSIQVRLDKPCSCMLHILYGAVCLPTCVLAICKDVS